MQRNFYEIEGINGINQINEIQELQEIDERITRMMRNVTSFVEPVEEIPSAESMEQRLYNLMAERQEYANELYDTLSIREAVPQYSVSILFLDTSQNEFEFEEEMENEMEIENSFWDPVVVHLTSQQIENIQTVNLNQECSICNVEKDSFKKVQCCNNVLCVDCCTSWFLTSVYCTFCRGDLREDGLRQDGLSNHLTI